MCTNLFLQIELERKAVSQLGKCTCISFYATGLRMEEMKDTQVCSHSLRGNTAREPRVAVVRKPGETEKVKW